MTVIVETLEKLERKITLNLSASAISAEVQTRLKKIARTVKMDGFRPGRVPQSVVAQRYGYSVYSEVLNDKVGEVFQDAIAQTQLRVAGRPRITELEQPAESGEMRFDAVFEVYPEVIIGELGDAEVDKFESQVSEQAVEKTLEILRRQRRTFTDRARSAPAAQGDRVTVDFCGTIEGESFEGGQAKDFQFVVGEGQMLEEFDLGVCGMRAGESKTLTLTFPPDYRSKEVAGKTADFMLTLHKVEATHLPELSDALAGALGVKDATLEGLRADIRANLEREVRFRLVNKNKQSVMQLLLDRAQLELPQSIVAGEIERLTHEAREELKARGLKDADKAPLPEDLFTAQAQRRVRLGLIVRELVQANRLEPTEAQVKAYVEEVAASYEKPGEVVGWYMGEQQRLAEVRAIVMENNVMNHVLAKAKIVSRSISFDELMGQG